MPALRLPEISSAAQPKGKIIKKRKILSDVVTTQDETVHHMKTMAKSVEMELDASGTAESLPHSKRNKKNKRETPVNVEEPDGNSETSSELGEPIDCRKVHSRPSKRVRLNEDVGCTEEEAVIDDDDKDNPAALSNFKISTPLRDKLISNGIQSLFPIQAMTFDVILSGSDLVGRARTGQGKTLAFVLPILESLVNGPAKTTRRTGYGRPPSVLVLLPTRELANQVYADFDAYGGTLGLTSCCLYGGMPYNPQENALKRGADIVIGTPGRVKDHLDRGTLDLRSLKFRILDEADEMLRMGFVEDVELILGKVGDVTKVQTLLFSATLPGWVKEIASKFLNSQKKTVDLVGSEKMKASTSVRHIALPCFHSVRAKIIPDIIRCYSSRGRTIIFTETKNSTSELAEQIPGARALHGDIQQSQREVILAGFRSGKFSVLVATNVAARGLDICDVQLIIQCEPPKDVEAYIHRSGRTGRAGNTGVAVLLYDPKKSFLITKIEKESGVKFEHVSAPQPAEIAKAAGSEAAEALTDVYDSVVPVFKLAAEELIKSSGLSAVDLLAKALAKIAGYTDIKKRSLLTSLENYVTLLLKSQRGGIYNSSFAFSLLRRYVPQEKLEELRGLSLTNDGGGAVFDVPAEDVDLFLAGKESGFNVQILEELPSLQDRDQLRVRPGYQSRDGGRSNWSEGRRGGNGRGGRRSGWSDEWWGHSYGGGRGRSSLHWKRGGSRSGF